MNFDSILKRGANVLLGRWRKDKHSQNVRWLSKSIHWELKWVCFLPERYSHMKTLHPVTSLIFVADVSHPPRLVAVETSCMLLGCFSRCSRVFKVVCFYSVHTALPSVFLLYKMQRCHHGQHRIYWRLDKGELKGFQFSMDWMKPFWFCCTRRAKG